MSGWCPTLSASAPTPLTKTIASLKVRNRYVRSIALPARVQPGVRSSSAKTAASLSSVIGRRDAGPRTHGAPPDAPWRRVAGRPSCSHAGELLERADLAERRLLAPLRGPGDFGHVEGAARVDGAAVRRHELARLLAREGAADPSDQIALEGEDAHARAEVRHLGVHGEV